MLLKQATAAVVPFYIALTGQNPTVALSKNGGGPIAGGGVVELSGGWYTVALTSSDTDTLGYLLLDCTDGDDAHDCHQITATGTEVPTLPTTAATILALRAASAIH